MIAHGDLTAAAYPGLRRGPAHLKQRHRDTVSDDQYEMSLSPKAYTLLCGCFAALGSILFGYVSGSVITADANSR